MFSKKKQPPIRTLIGEGTVIVGELRFTEGLRIDVVAPIQPWVKAAIAKAEATAYGPMVSAPFLVITKLWDSRGSHDERASRSWTTRMGKLP